MYCGKRFCMFRLYKIALLTALGAGLLFVTAQRSPADGIVVLFREEFADLDQWKPLHFPKIPRHTAYAAQTLDGLTVLRADADASASGLAFRQDFDIRAYPRLRWRWRVENLLAKATPEVKSGDDYPIRIYVSFAYDPARAGFLDRIKYELARRIYGQYPPQSTLNYVWASKGTKGKVYTSPYADSVKMIFLESGPERVGQWVEEDVDLMADYRRSFGVDPPKALAGIAIMSDADNTGESVRAYIDYIELSSTGAAK